MGGGLVRIAGFPKLCCGNLTWRLAVFFDTLIARKLLSMQLTALAVGLHDLCVRYFCVYIHKSLTGGSSVLLLFDLKQPKHV